MSEVRPHHRLLFGAMAVAIVAAGATAGFVASRTSRGPRVSPLVAVPSLIGLTQRVAVDELRADGIASRVEPSVPNAESTSPGVPHGIVVAQSPSSGSVVGVEATVIVFVASNSQPEVRSQVPATGRGGRLLSTITIGNRACTMAPARAHASPSIPIGAAIANATSRGLIMTRVTGRSGGAPRVVAFYGMLQCSINLPRHRALVWLVEYPNDRILNFNSPSGGHPSPFVGTMFVVVNPRSGIANESFGGPIVDLKRD